MELQSKFPKDINEYLELGITHFIFQFIGLDERSLKLSYKQIILATPLDNIKGSTVIEFSKIVHASPQEDTTVLLLYWNDRAQLREQAFFFLREIMPLLAESSEIHKYLNFLYECGVTAHKHT